MSHKIEIQPGSVVMDWHKKSPWNLIANEAYEKYKPMISTL